MSQVTTDELVELNIAAVQTTCVVERCVNGINPLLFRRPDALGLSSSFVALPLA